MHALTRSRRVATIVGAAAALMVLGQAAQAVPVYLEGNDDTLLVGGKLSRWDVYNNTSACESDSPGYTPADDGELGTEGSSDAFDGGLLFMVGPANGVVDDAATFFDGNSIGSKTGEQIVVGPKLTGGLKVKRWDRALPKSPTMRSLIALRNTSNSPRTRDVYLDTNLGSDGLTDIRRTSNGSANLLNASRWVVTSDSATDPGDPVVTHVLWGKRARSKTAEVVNNPGAGAPADCLTVRMRVRVPKKSVRYLLFFAEMNPTNAGGISSAAKFNKRTLNKRLLAGIGPGVRNKILNWRLG
ncbi:MAG TPA: hypothetical protein VF058_02655 [Actinomycetota bacterium]